MPKVIGVSFDNPRLFELFYYYGASSLPERGAALRITGEFTQAFRQTIAVTRFVGEAGHILNQGIRDAVYSGSDHGNFSCTSLDDDIAETFTIAWQA